MTANFVHPSCQFCPPHLPILSTLSSNYGGQNWQRANFIRLVSALSQFCPPKSGQNWQKDGQNWQNGGQNWQMALTNAESRGQNWQLKCSRNSAAEYLPLFYHCTSRRMFGHQFVPWLADFAG